MALLGVLRAWEKVKGVYKLGRSSDKCAAPRLPREKEKQIGISGWWGEASASAMVKNKPKARGRLEPHSHQCITTPLPYDTP